MDYGFHPGDVVYFVTPGNRNGRRVLVEEIEESTSKEATLVRGVEVTSRFDFRGRRGTRPLTSKLFWLWIPNVQGIVPAADTRVTALRERLAEYRGRFPSY